MRVERLPFTVYDIVGYFFPGVLAIAALSWFARGHFQSDLFWLIEVGPEIQASSEMPEWFSGVLDVVVFGIVAFAIGHVISFLSSVTIERLTNEFVGYPSEYLLAPMGFVGPVGQRFMTQRLKGFFKSSMVLLNVLFFPIYLFFVVVNVTGTIRAVVKPLTEPQANILRERFAATFQQDMADHPPGSSFALVCGYMFHNFPEIAARMYNYVVLYGFLRTLTFLSYVIAVCFGIRVFVDLCSGTYPNAWFAFIVTMSICFCFLLAFIKFYRRYSREAVISFITFDKELHK